MNTGRGYDLEDSGVCDTVMQGHNNGGIYSELYSQITSEGFHN